MNGRRKKTKHTSSTSSNTRFLAAILCVYILLAIIIIPLIITIIAAQSKLTGQITDEEEIVNDSGILVKREIWQGEDTENENSAETPAKNLKYNKKLESYVVSVVAAEMPANFNAEALKAQAVAARTYAVKNTPDLNNINPDKIGQAYISVADMKKRWGKNFKTYYAKINDAVDATRAIIMYYNGEPIEAVFHSTSAGITETAQNVWGRELPYIKSVDSSYDVNAPDFKSTVEISRDKFISIIKSSFNIQEGINPFDAFTIAERTDAGYVKTVKIGDTYVSGKTIRELLALRSTYFTIYKKNDKIIFTTQGYGHGVGMSQYGAQFMAESGKGYEEILKHYYYNITLDGMYKQQPKSQAAANVK